MKADPRFGRSVCAAALAAMMMSPVAAQAHGIWFAQRAKQLALIYGVGADDLDMVRADDDTSQGTRRAPLEEVTRNIAAAALVPVERTGRFGRVTA